MKAGQIYLILIVLIITHGTFYLMGRNAESREYEKEIDLSFEAAAQQYKNYYDDTSKFDYYGNERTETDTLRRVLQQNSRTKITKPIVNRDKKQNDQTRKRN